MALIKKKSAKESEKATLVGCIVKRIMSLYKILLEKHSDKLEIYDQFMIFCKYAEQTSEIPSILDKMLKHNRSASAYLKAIIYESEDAKNITRARAHVCRGIQDHPTCVELYELFLKMELDTISKKLEDKTVEENSDEVSLDRPIVIFQTVKDKMDTPNIFISFLNIANSYSFTKKFQLEIMSYLLQMYSSDPIIWHTLAQRVFNNMVTSNEVQEDKEPDFITLARKCILVYKNATEMVCFFYVFLII